MFSSIYTRLAFAALPLVLSAPATAKDTPPPVAAAAMAPEVRMDHISIVETGRGSPVVLIPGLACPRAVYEPIAADLAKRHRVLLVQVNGFGGDDPGANLSGDVLNGIVADLDTYLTRHKLRGASVIGHSMGGLVGLMLAKAHPQDLSRLMVVDALPYFAVLMAPPGVDPTPAMVAPQAAMMRDRIAANHGKTISDADLDAQTRGLALKPASVAVMKQWAARADARVTARAMYEDLTTDLRGDLKSIATPITLLYPWNDAPGPNKVMADAFYRRQFAAAPNVRYVDIGDAAHMVMLDQPAAFGKAVDDFLK